MKLTQNVELHGFRLELSVYTLDKAGHKILSEMDSSDQSNVLRFLELAGIDIIKYMSPINAMPTLSEPRQPITRSYE